MMKNERRFVFDANVLVSALLFSQSLPRQALDRGLKLGVILLSDAVFTELEMVIFRPKFDRYLTLTRRQEFLADLLETAFFIKINEQVEECRDPQDNKYLELAVNGQADCLITGDQDLLVLNPFRGVDILTVREFLAKTDN